MSGNNHHLRKGDPLLHHGNKKIVKCWHFISVGGGISNNTDMIVIEFEDGTDTGEEGVGYISFELIPSLENLKLNLDLLSCLPNWHYIRDMRVSDIESFVKREDRLNSDADKKAKEILLKMGS